MKFRAEIDVMPHKALLDPQGKTVGHSMLSMGLTEIGNVRIGKHITLEIEVNSKEEAQEKEEAACTQLLANPIMESYTYELFAQG
jgi:phosphoribosylformylglycinamidine synthase